MMSLVMVRVVVLVCTAILTMTGGGSGAVAAAAAAAAESAVSSDDAVVVEVFWGDGCPYCEELLDHLDELGGELDGFVVEAHEVWNDPAGRALLFQRAAELGVDVEAVPFTIVGTTSWVGFTNSIARQIDAAIVAALPATADAPIGPQPPPPDEGTVIDVPIVGDVDVDGRSLVLTTVLIGFVDGFNPCSLWVLTVLLALVLHTGSRRRVVLIGGSFLVVTTVIYGLFVLGVYSALSLAGSLDWIRGVVAVLALTFGLINVKDYFWYKVGPSMTIPDEAKPGIYRSARRLVRPGISLPAAMAGAALMAVGVSLVEIPCTAGFPVIWSDLVRASGASSLAFGMLLALYLVVYLIDELLVFGLAVVTMRVTRLQEHHGRALKLVGGMIMITIGVTILVAPEAMNDVTGVVVVFGIAVVASALVAALDRLIGGRRPATG